jgi:hypothetical protein
MSEYQNEPKFVNLYKTLIEDVLKGGDKHY